MVDLKLFQETKANNFIEGKHKNGEVHMFLVYNILKGRQSSPLALIRKGEKVGIIRYYNSKYSKA